ncbi:MULTISPECIES: hypothetical protein [Staphylococcus]|nr:MULTISPECIES: hypothetical protein [Staphylococcus]MDK6387944.1 hypothetical protein [Staphylococcus lugdunensis]MDK7913513.1 hypothetical protein [Staphylococcus lugdunensis]MDK8715723.1 hypothetical protein [Staphylococcus lugdunensis]MDU7612641.1 hypothetical protein [Staphylococcus lugdunensis]
MRQAFQRTTQVGVGPQQREMRSAFRQAQQVGVGPTETVWHIIIF